jgi:hypothetical protein
MDNRKRFIKVVNKGYGRKNAFIIEFSRSPNSDLGYEGAMQYT